jgi:hypothetical protein
VIVRMVINACSAEAEVVSSNLAKRTITYKNLLPQVGETSPRSSFNLLVG